MEILVLIAGALLVLYFIGRRMGDPDPSRQGDAWLKNRLNSERSWVRRYLSLPLQQQASESLKNSFQRRSAYIKQIENEIQSRLVKRTLHDEMASAGRAAAQTITAIMKSENVNMDEAAAIFIQRSENAEKQAQYEQMKQEHDAKVLKERFLAIVKDFQSKGYTEEQSSDRAVQQINRENIEKELQDAIIAADNGDMDAQFKAAEIYRVHGYKNEAEAASLYWKAANQGHLDAISILYNGPYHNYITIPQRWQLAEWMAQAGNSSGQGLRGEKYFRIDEQASCQSQLGERYFRDGEFEQAFHWLTKAASKKGAPAYDYQRSAQYYLAILYSEGKGCIKNDDIARDYLLKSAEQGFAPAQYYVGLLHISGEGMPIDLERAYMWLSLSIGINLPKNPVHGLPSFSEAMEARKSVADAMTPDQIERAKALVKEWRRK